MTQAVHGLALELGLEVSPRILKPGGRRGWTGVKPQVRTYARWSNASGRTHGNVRSPLRRPVARPAEPGAMDDK